VRGKWNSLYRAADKRGKTVDFLLRPDRGIAAAQAFFRKALPRYLPRWPRKITLDGLKQSHLALHWVTGGSVFMHGILPPASPDFLSAGVQTVPNTLQGIPAVVLLLAATILEASGDAVVRMAMYNHVGLVRFGLFIGGAALLFGYGTFLNLAPLQFGQVVGLYLATLFVVWQVINFVAFRSLPTLPIVVGGALVVAGGAIITFWKPT
jgi:hypothetical protein